MSVRTSSSSMQTKPSASLQQTPQSKLSLSKGPLYKTVTSSTNLYTAFKSPVRISNKGSFSASETDRDQKSQALPSAKEGCVSYQWSKLIPRRLHESEEDIAKDIVELKTQLKSTESEVAELSKLYSEEELEQHIEKLHKYNEIKDVGQLLLGKVAEIQGTTTSHLYEYFGLELDD